MSGPQLPDTAAIRALRQWLTPRVTMDPAQEVLSLLQALAEAGYVVYPMSSPSDLVEAEARGIAKGREEAARLCDVLGNGLFSPLENRAFCAAAASIRALPMPSAAQ